MRDFSNSYIKDMISKEEILQLLNDTESYNKYKIMNLKNLMGGRNITKIHVARKMLVLVMTIFLFVIANAQSATDELLHSKFDFNANRRIDLNGVNINDIDRIVQTEKFIWFLMNKGNTNPILSTTTINEEWDEALKFSSELFERYIELPYTIPICLYYEKLDGATGTANVISSTELQEGLSYGIICVDNQNPSLMNLSVPKEGTPLGGALGLGTIIHELAHTMGLNGEYPGEVFYSRGEHGPNGTLYYLDTEQTRKANGGYPIQMNWGDIAHLAFPFWNIDYGCNLLNFGGGGYPYLDNFEGEVYYRIGSALLGVLESAGWKVKSEIDYTRNTYTGILFDEEGRTWESYDNKIFYGSSGTNCKTSYTFQDWKDGKVSYDEYESNWKTQVDTTDWLDFITHLPFESYFFVYISNYIKNIFWEHENGYDYFITYLNYYICETYTGAAMRDITKSRLLTKYPMSDVLHASIQTIWENHIAGWADFVYSQDWLEYAKTKGSEDVLTEMNRLFTEKDRSAYDAFIHSLSQQICWAYLSDYGLLGETEAYLREMYPLDKIITTNIKYDIFDKTIVFGENGTIYIKSNNIGKKIMIYTIDGKLIRQNIISSSEMEIPTGKGFFIVSVNGRSFKILIR